MNRDAPQPPISLQIARRLLALEAAQGNEGEPERVGAALQRTCLRVSETLRDSMGEGGSNALLVRAFLRSEGDHPLLKNIYRLNGGTLHLDGVVASVEAHGVSGVTTAIEALLAALFDILSRLIGEDMTIRLFDHDAPRSQSGDEGRAP
jgi:hypothetical protein